MKSVIGGTTTAFVGTLLEWSGSSSTMKKYYYAGSERIAMRTGSSTLNYILGDHLALTGCCASSASVTTDSAGNNAVYALYKPCPQGVLCEGESRYNSGALPTKYTDTGQYSNLGCFAQSGNVAAWDRYALIALVEDVL